mmetsp:Transcript_144034/g.461007  ORF Transcript_144034/g.461007 Transcript_144034/m.461007 type:complete len:260 (+) Transcript_144034:2095-2874(+)
MVCVQHAKHLRQEVLRVGIAFCWLAVRQLGELHQSLRRGTEVLHDRGDHCGLHVPKLGLVLPSRGSASVHTVHRARTRATIMAATTAAAAASAASGTSSPAAARPLVAEDTRTAKELRPKVDSILRGLAASHDIGEALRQFRELSAPAGECQKDLLSHMLVHISEATGAARLPMWGCVAQLFAEDVFQREALVAGLDAFMANVFGDLKCDVPKLPTIVTEELLPALTGQAGLLSASDAARLKEKALSDEDEDDGGEAES